MEDASEVVLIFNLELEIDLPPGNTTDTSNVTCGLLPLGCVVVVAGMEDDGDNTSGDEEISGEESVTREVADISGNICLIGATRCKRN